MFLLWDTGVTLNHKYRTKERDNVTTGTVSLLSLPTNIYYTKISYNILDSGKGLRMTHKVAMNITIF